MAFFFGDLPIGLDFFGDPFGKRRKDGDWLTCCRFILLSTKENRPFHVLSSLLKG